MNAGSQELRPNRDLDPSLGSKFAALESGMASRDSVLVAFSGGVDSALVAALAQRSGRRCLAVTAAAETLAGRELDHARQAAQEIGIDHKVVTYSELDNPEFVRNPKSRCYHCQGMRMDTMVGLAAELRYGAVCDGTNASDPGPDRPGLKAIEERGVVSPLLEAGVTKDETRALARWLGLSVWDRPANACLSSRIPHGQIVTLGKLRRVEAAEDLLAQRGYRVFRVRHDGRQARVEVGVNEVARLEAEWPELREGLATLGFEDAVADLRGYTSGGANRSIAANRSTAKGDQ